MTKRLSFLLLICVACITTGAQVSHNKTIKSGQIWPDDKGVHINAHGGGIMKYGNTYYWFGEHKADTTSSAMVGVMCYSSDDLVNWKNRGVALSVSDEKGHDTERGCILERPKVIYNKATKKFCMWFHLELKGRGYSAARYGVAVSDKPEGPYKFLYSKRANAGIYPIEFKDEQKSIMDTLNADNFKEWWTPTWYEAVTKGLILKRDFGTGQMARDMTLYIDDDGKAYHIFSSEENLTLHIAELTNDFLHHSGRYTRVAPGGQNEAPAIFKKDGTYWMITSGCTGWAPNEARMFSAPSIWGPWTQHPNPCVGPRANKTFGGQSTYILPVSDQYIFMADIWRPNHPSDARYIWLPIEFDNGKPVIRWQDEWELSTTSSNKKQAQVHQSAAEEVKDIIRKVNTYWQTNNPAEVRAFWDNAAYHTGNIEVYKLLKDQQMLDYSIRWAEHNQWKGATEPDPAKWKYKQYGEGQDYVLFGDWQICFQTYIDLYNLAPDDKKVARAKEVMGYEASSKAHDYWWWADALYMVMPVMTKMYKLTGDTKYLNKLYENLCYCDSIMLDTETGLYFRDGKYVYPKHKTESGKKDFWARGDGWVLAGLAKVLQDMPTDYVRHPFFVEKYQRLARAVKQIQQPGGYWTRSMMDPQQAPGPETSGTAFFTYGLLWGVNNGYLPKKEFAPTIEKAWKYLTKIALQKDGKVGYVQPIGERAIPGQKVDANSQANFGVGAFLLAACEYVRYISQ